MQWYKSSIEELIRLLDSSQQGLRTAEAEERLEKKWFQPTGRGAAEEATNYFVGSIQGFNDPDPIGRSDCIGSDG